MNTFYGVEEICEYCRQVAFHDDPDYAEMMGFTLRDGEWVLKTLPEYGNEVACSNCGDEWADTYTDGLCGECLEIRG
jgi:hypothetical protein